MASEAGGDNTESVSVANSFRLLSDVLRSGGGKCPRKGASESRDSNAVVKREENGVAESLLLLKERLLMPTNSEAKMNFNRNFFPSGNPNLNAKASSHSGGSNLNMEKSYYQKMRERNNEASKRCRLKRRQKTETIEQQSIRLGVINNLLTKRFDHLQGIFGVLRQAIDGINTGDCNCDKTVNDLKILVAQTLKDSRMSNSQLVQMSLAIRKVDDAYLDNNNEAKLCEGYSRSTSVTPPGNPRQLHRMPALMPLVSPKLPSLAMPNFNTSNPLVPTESYNKSYSSSSYSLLQSSPVKPLLEQCSSMKRILERRSSSNEFLPNRSSSPTPGGIIDSYLKGSSSTSLSSPNNPMPISFIQSYLSALNSNVISRTDKSGIHLNPGAGSQATDLSIKSRSTEDDEPILVEEEAGSEGELRDGEEGVDPLLNCVAAGLDMKANCEGPKHDLNSLTTILNLEDLSPFSGDIENGPNSSAFTAMERAVIKSRLRIPFWKPDEASSFICERHRNLLLENPTSSPVHCSLCFKRRSQHQKSSFWTITYRISLEAYTTTGNFLPIGLPVCASCRERNLKEFIFIIQSLLLLPSINCWYKVFISKAVDFSGSQPYLRRMEKSSKDCGEKIALKRSKSNEDLGEDEHSKSKISKLNDALSAFNPEYKPLGFSITSTDSCSKAVLDDAVNSAKAGISAVIGVIAAPGQEGNLWALVRESLDEKFARQDSSSQK